WGRWLHRDWLGLLFLPGDGPQDIASDATQYGSKLPLDPTCETQNNCRCDDTHNCDDLKKLRLRNISETLSLRIATTIQKAAHIKTKPAVARTDSHQTYCSLI